MADITEDKVKSSRKVIGVLVGLVVLSAVVLVSYGHIRHSQSTLNALFLYLLFTGIGTGVAALLWTFEDDEDVQAEFVSFRIVWGLFASCIVLICLFASYDFFLGGGVFPPVIIVGIGILVLLVATIVLILSHIARKKNPKEDPLKYVKVVPIVLYVLVFLTGILGRSMLRRFAVPLVQYMKDSGDISKNRLQLALYGLPITSACIWGASQGFFNKLLLPLKMILQSEPGDFEANAQEVANAVGVVKNDIRGEAAEYKELKLTGDNVGEFAKKSLIHLAVQTGDLFVMEEEHAKKTMLAMQEASHNVKKMILPILRAFYPLSPTGLAMLARTVIANSIAHTLAQKGSSALSKRVKRKSALAAGTFLIVFLSIVFGGVGIAAAVTGLFYIPIRIFPKFLGAWNDQSPLDVAQVMAFRLLRIIDLRGYSGVGEAEGLLDYMCYATFKLWTRFKEADALCLFVQNNPKDGSIYSAEDDAVKIKLGAFSKFKETTRTILVDLMNIGPAENRGFLGNAVTTMQQCIIDAETAVRDNKVDLLPGIIHDMTRALMEPNMKLMKAHRVLYLVALCIIATCAGIGNSVGASLPKKKDPTIDRQRETATTAMIICCVILISVNAYLALK